jgi:hypothetical protein
MSNSTFNGKVMGAVLSVGPAVEAVVAGTLNQPGLENTIYPFIAEATVHITFRQ